MNLLAECQRIETFRKSIEHSRYKIANILGFTSFILLLLVLCMLFMKTRLFQDWSFQFTPLMFVCVAGALGGLLSTTQRVISIRIWTESIDQVLELQRSLTSWLFIPPILGVLFAVTMFLLFSSDLLTGPFFPRIVTELPTSNITFKTLHTPDKILAFLKNTSPVEAIDFSKLIVWSFIAGFFQRFVPDALSRLARESNPRTEEGLA